MSNYFIYSIVGLWSSSCEVWLCHSMRACHWVWAGTK